MLAASEGRGEAAGTAATGRRAVTANRDTSDAAISIARTMKYRRYLLTVRSMDGIHDCSAASKCQAEFRVVLMDHLFKEHATQDWFAVYTHGPKLLEEPVFLKQNCFWRPQL